MSSEPAFGPRQIVVWAVAVLVFLVTIEASIRVDDRLRWGAPLLGAYSHEALFVADSIGWHPLPGAQYQKWVINEHGFRGPDFVRQKAPGVVRVAVLGSSETFGQAESPGNEFPRVLERRLNERIADDPTFEDTRFEVINAGIPGMSVRAMNDYWKHWVSSFDVDAVVLYPAPTFYLGTDDPAVPMDVPEGGARVASDTPRLFAKSREAINRFLPERVEAAMKEVMMSRQAADHDESWSWEEIPADRLASYVGDVANLVEVVSESGAGVVLATHASALERPLDAQESAVLLGWRKFFPRASEDVILDFEARANSDVAELGDEMGVRVVRADRSVPAEMGLFSDHVHFTDAGALRLAESLIDPVLAVTRQSSVGVGSR